MATPDRLEPAVFRPALRGLGRALLLGTGGGFLFGALLGVSPLLGGGMGAVAALLALAIGQATGLRVVADERGLAVRGGAVELDARWGELRLGFGAAARPGPAQRYAIVADARGRSFAFADFAGAPPAEPVRGADGEYLDVVDLRDAPLLLALLVQRVPAWDLLPPGLRAPPVEARALAPELAADAASASTGRAAPERRPRVGLLGLAGKLGASLVKALKTANLGWAVASAGAWAVILPWQLALALLVQLFVHEYGHVHAMRRTGMRVRGLYLVPFLGAVAVSEDSFTSRRQQVYVALSGPIWGSLLALAPAALWLWTRNPLYAHVCAVWALINLLNLVPIAPLDGGRIMQGLAFSFSSALGVALTALALGGAVVVGTRYGYGLVWLVAGIGLLEFLGDAQARPTARALRLLPDRSRLGTEQFRWLRAVAGPPLGHPTERLFLRGLEVSERSARAVPMRPLQALGWGVGYAALAAALLALVHFMAQVPGAETAARLLS
jgi:Zn-dependent protease